MKIEYIIKELKESGLSKIETILHLYNNNHISSLKEAKILVHNSLAWANSKEEHNKFHTELEKILESEAESDKMQEPLFYEIIAPEGADPLAEMDRAHQEAEALREEAYEEERRKRWRAARRRRLLEELEEQDERSSD